MAMDQIQQRFGLKMGAVQWVPNIEDMAYHLYMEWLDHRGDRWIQQVMLPALDKALSQLNTEYEQKRASRRLHPLRLHRMRIGWADAVKRQAIARGGRDVQYKWTVLCSDTTMTIPTADYEDTMLCLTEI